ncbi:hypothetical protein BGX31_006860 [Mortierella sp. GBA43]|nr:hypothetical protein BGX31_006860 [Mortierella sp. GBA43]
MSRSKASAFGILSSNAGCIYGTEELKDILSGREATLQQKMEGAESMESFLIELVDTLEAILSSRAAKAENEKSVSYWASITEQLDTLGWDKVAYLSEDLSRVQIDLWNDCKLPRENLEVLLELPNGFPSPVTVTKDEMNIECGICYSFRFDGRIPDQLCSHSKCQQPFHRVCLYEVESLQKMGTSGHR